MLLHRTRTFRLQSRPAVAIVCIVMVSASACTKTVKIPHADYGEMDPGKGDYVIITRDGKKIRTDRFKVTENGFLIEAVKDPHAQTVEPYEIKFEDIVSVSRQAYDPVNIVLLTVLVVVVVAGVAVLVCIEYCPPIAGGN